MRTVITAERLWNGSHMIDHPVVTIEDGASWIRSRWADLSNRREDAQVLDFPGATLAPAFFDVHFHGAAGHDVMEATPDASRPSAVSGLARHGILSGDDSDRADRRHTDGAFEVWRRSFEQPAVAGQARPVGIHLEGPFLSHAKRGVQPAAHLLAPDIAAFDQLYDAAEGQVRLMTLAPELPGARELAAHATARGVRVSLGHSNATAAETRLPSRPAP